jgi:hypothetical protein
MAPQGWLQRSSVTPDDNLIARDRKLHLNSARIWGDQMKSSSPSWVWVALTLALLMIGYVAAPLVLVSEAITLWGWGSSETR